MNVRNGFESGMGSPFPDLPEVMNLNVSTGSDPAAVRARVEAVEMLLERSLRIPGVNVPVGLDAVLGLIPLVGDAADFVFRSNTRNLRIIKKYLDKHHPETRIIEG